MGGPAIFRQQRPGLHGRIFTLCKFRTMSDARQPDGTPKPDAERLTPLGRFLRRTSLDELPQLWNVLRGEYESGRAAALVDAVLGSVHARAGSPARRAAGHHRLGPSPRPQRDHLGREVRPGRVVRRPLEPAGWTCASCSGPSGRSFVAEGSARRRALRCSSFEDRDAPRREGPQWNALVIVGAGGFGREVFSMIREINEARDDLGRDWFSGRQSGGARRLFALSARVGFDRSLSGICHRPKRRARSAARRSESKSWIDLAEHGVRWATILHPTVRIGVGSTMGTGCIVCARAGVTVDVRIGNHVHINCLAGERPRRADGRFLHHPAHVDVCGRAILEEGVFLGSHAVVLPGVRVGAWAASAPAAWPSAMCPREKPCLACLPGDLRPSKAPADAMRRERPANHK